MVAGNCTLIILVDEYTGVPPADTTVHIEGDLFNSTYLIVVLALVAIIVILAIKIIMKRKTN